MGRWENSNDSRITSVEWLNSHDESLAMVGGDDGSVRVWRPDYEKGKPKYVLGLNQRNLVYFFSGIFSFIIPDCYQPGRHCQKSDS